MSENYYTYDTITGTEYGDILLADYATAQAMHYVDNGSGYDTYHSWSRKVVGLDGDDWIRRDRPGDYKADAFVFEGTSEEGTLENWTFETQGHVGIYGDGGTDKVDYSLYQGALEIDLRPMGQAAENAFTSDVRTYFNPENKGFAKDLGPSGVGIFGQDFLYSIEDVIGTDFGDLIIGTDGANTLNGGDGADTILGGGGNDFLKGEFGNDEIWGEDGNDVITGGSGSDTVHGGSGVDIINTGAGGDDVSGGDDGDIIMTDSGADTVHGDDGDDQIWGGSNADMLFGDAGDDTLWGGTGNDTLKGGDGLNTVNGQEGDDQITIKQVDSLIDGGDGFDMVIHAYGGTEDMYVRIKSSGNGYIEKLNSPGSWKTQLKDIEAVTTGNGDDVISFTGFGLIDNEANGGFGDDTIMMGNGDDIAWGDYGDDLLIGHTGNDFLNGGAHNDEIRGGYGNDTLEGASGDDLLNGSAGDDTLSGGNGADTIRGGHGADELSGGDQADTFSWKDGDDGLDTLIDFELGFDIIDVDDFLASPPIAINEGYVGKVAALPTAFEDTTALYALTDDGWSAFAWIEGYNNETIADAIVTGELFGLWQEPGLLDDGGAGPDRGDALTQQIDLPGNDIIIPENDFFLL